MNRPETISALSIRLPQADRSLETYKLSVPKSFPDKVSGPMNRIAVTPRTPMRFLEVWSQTPCTELPPSALGVAVRVM